MKHEMKLNVEPFDKIKNGKKTIELRLNDEKRQLIIDLYDLYGLLLTDKQREYFEDYYFMDLSITEMAENYGVSRNAVFKQIHIVLEKLEEYERILKLREKREKILTIVKDPKTKKEIEEIL